MLSRQEEQAERRRVFADQSLPNQATTMHQFAQADAQTPRGRFTQVDAATVVGANPTIDYPAGPAWSADPGAQCVEPPLGFDNPALEPSSCEAQAPDGPADPSAPLDVERAGPSLSPDMAAQCRSQMSSSTRPDDDGGIERPPANKFRRRRL